MQELYASLQKHAYGAIAEAVCTLGSARAPICDDKIGLTIPVNISHRDS